MMAMDLAEIILLLNRWVFRAVALDSVVRPGAARVMGDMVNGCWVRTPSPHA